MLVKHKRVSVCASLLSVAAVGLNKCTCLQSVTYHCFVRLIVVFCLCCKSLQNNWMLS
jgi:hypothetical protein